MRPRYDWKGIMSRISNKLRVLDEVAWLSGYFPLYGIKTERHYIERGEHQLQFIMISYNFDCRQCKCLIHEHKD